MKALAPLLLFVLPALSHAAPKAELTFSLAVSSSPFGPLPAASLSCNDKVYAHIRLSTPTAGTHLLEGRWYLPDGRLKEYTKVPLVLKAAQDQLQLWLKIERAGDTTDVFFTHSDEDELDGLWTLDVYWDKKKVASRKFKLHCA